MAFFQTIIDFFESVFNRSSPKVQKKLLKKKLEAEVAKLTPVLYKNGNITANFAEALYILYINSKPLDDLFCETISSSDIQRQMRFKMQLVFTGFTAEEQEVIESLSYDERKREILNKDEAAEKRILEDQYARLERVIAALNNDAFKSMDRNLAALHQFADLCHYNFATPIQMFDTNFMGGNTSYKPSYHYVPLEKLDKVLEDLYYQMADLQITNATGNAVLALLQMRLGDEPSKELCDKYLTNIKKIATAVTHILNENNLKQLLRLNKLDAAYEPKKSVYGEKSARQDFSNKLQTQYKADEQRIRAEIKDEKIKSELLNLFGNVPLLPISGYTQEINENLHANFSIAFTEIMPLQILKTFLNIYFPPQLESLLNDIVVEGFFNNPSFKTDFAGIVYGVSECMEHITAFEKSFEKDNTNDIALLESYMHDSRKDASFHKRMTNMVDSINNQAQKLLQEQVGVLQALYNVLSEIVVDARKPSSEMIQNLKVLMLSPRNKESSDLLDKQFPNWHLFFEIMRNYTVVSIKEK